MFASGYRTLILSSGTRRLYFLVRSHFIFFFAFVFARTATVSRRILKEHYQGELESDESENNLDDEEDSFETEDYSEPVQVTTTTATPSPHQVVDDGYLFKNLQPTGRPDYKRTGFLGK